MNLDVPVIGIVRGIDGSRFRHILDASFAGGLTAMEITMNTPGATKILQDNRANVPSGKYLGMGTIRTVEEARMASDAGAMFFVTPNTDTRVIEYAVEKNIPVIAGALTPTEVYMAWSAGATMVKVFPAGTLGPGYIRDLRGPFDRIPLVAVGGINKGNVWDYLDAGAVAVGVGGSLFGEDAVRSERYSEVRENVAKFIEQCSKNN
jgi:2-dehydro-3-deoxyphosphogluconate aldolase/(4S)-4-hydroxy-2-oxoglutarate aldolase